MDDYYTSTLKIEEKKRKRNVIIFAVVNVVSLIFLPILGASGASGWVVLDFLLMIISLIALIVNLIKLRTAKKELIKHLEYVEKLQEEAKQNGYLVDAWWNRYRIYKEKNDDEVKMAADSMDSAAMTVLGERLEEKDKVENNRSVSFVGYNLFLAAAIKDKYALFARAQFIWDLYQELNVQLTLGDLMEGTKNDIEKYRKLERLYLSEDHSSFSLNAETNKLWNHINTMCACEMYFKGASEAASQVKYYLPKYEYGEWDYIRDFLDIMVDKYPKADQEFHNASQIYLNMSATDPNIYTAKNDYESSLKEKATIYDELYDICNNLMSDFDQVNRLPYIAQLTVIRLLYITESYGRLKEDFRSSHIYLKVDSERVRGYFKEFVDEIRSPFNVKENAIKLFSSNCIQLPNGTWVSK